MSSFRDFVDGAWEAHFTYCCPCCDYPDVGRLCPWLVLEARAYYVVFYATVLPRSVGA